MVYDYVVTLKNKNTRLVDNISILLAVLSLIVFINLLITDGLNTVLIVLCVLIFVIMGVTFLVRPTSTTFRSFSRVLLLAGVGWLMVPGLMWVSVPVIAMAFIEKPAKANLEIGFSQGEIVMNTLIKRRFAWSDFNNIMLKDDLLTMDFKNNKVFQRPTIEDDPDATEDEFNEYCAKQLSQRI